MLSKFVPGFVNQNVIDQDYTMLAIRRYAESAKYFWSGFIDKIKDQNDFIIDIVSSFQKNELREYKSIRRNFENTQYKYDNQLSKYLGFAKNKEASALREDAFQLAELRTAYIKASFELCTSLTSTQAKLDISLVDALSKPFILPPKEFALADPLPQRVSVEMLRLKTWAKSMTKGYTPLTKEMQHTAKEMEHAAIEHVQPSRDMSTYSTQNSTIAHFVPATKTKTEYLTEKHGWLFVKSSANKGVRQIWVRRWVFVKNGMFGWLNVSSSRTFVQESDKIGVLLCHVTPISTEDRRFCFEIKTTDTVLILQAESIEDMRAWLQVFEDAKRLAIESDTKTTISYASQRFPPLISEFAISSGASVDMELTNDKSTSKDEVVEGPALGSSVSLYKLPEMDNLLATMSAGESLEKTDNDTSKQEVEFSSVGPFGSALAPAPPLNVAMPTSMTQEAMISKSLLSNVDLPTTIETNYLGSQNWTLDQYNAKTSLTKSKEQATPTSGEITYPNSYPIGLRAQDMQLRSIFQGLVGTGPNDRTVLVCRCMIRINSTHHVPARLYFTPNGLFIYSHSLGMTSTFAIPIKALVSVEGRTKIQQDTLFIITSHGTTSFTVYLESRRILQKRIQFLIDNYHSPNPFTIEEIVQKLQEIGDGQRNDHWEIDEEDVSGQNDNTEKVSAMEAIFRDEERSPNEQKFLNLYLANFLKGEKLPVYAASAPKQLQPAVASSINEPDMSKLMTQLCVEHEFEHSPKTLFHVMFGEKSPVFRYDDSGSLIRTGVEFTPWILVDSQRMEREINFVIKQSSTFFASEHDKIMYTQRIESMDDNTMYVIYERRTVFNLPQGESFYTTFRYLISRKPQGTAKLSIWSSVEWVQSSLIKNMTEPFVLSKLKGEAKIIMNRTVHSCKQLSSKGGAITAIRLFGKIGTSDARKIEKKPLEIGETPRDLRPDGQADVRNSINVSRGSLGRSMWEIIGSLLISFLGELVLILQKILVAAWDGMRSNKIIILGCAISVLFNIYLAGYTGVSYWMELHSRQLADSMVLSSRSQPIMARSVLLQDIDVLIQNGTDFSIEAALLQDNNQDSSEPLCYNKFKSVALVPDLSEGSFMFTDAHAVSNGESDVASLTLKGSPFEHSSQTARNRIFDIRSQLGIKRNNLMVELRSINRIESEMVVSEWQSWLYEEVSLCSTLTQGLLDLKIGQKHSKSKKALEDKVGEQFANLLLKAPKETKLALTKYCQSCSRELDATLNSTEKF